MENLFLVFYLILTIIGFYIWLKSFLLVFTGRWQKPEMRIVWFCILILFPISCLLLLIMQKDFID